MTIPFGPAVVRVSADTDAGQPCDLGPAGGRAVVGPLLGHSSPHASLLAVLSDRVLYSV